MFSIKGKTFQFSMDDCVMRSENNICPIISGDESIKCKCNDIKKELVESNFVINDHIPEVVYHTKCKHYSCNDGQHRICVAGHMGKEIRINMCRENDVMCGFCDKWQKNISENETKVSIFIESF